MGASSVENATPGAAAALLKPVAAVDDPPTHGENRDGGCEGPPEGQQKIGKDPEHQDNQPEEPTMHGEIVRHSLFRLRMYRKVP